jgi:hypothetical protein
MENVVAYLTVWTQHLHEMTEENKHIKFKKNRFPVQILS